MADFRNGRHETWRNDFRQRRNLRYGKAHRALGLAAGLVVRAALDFVHGPGESTGDGTEQGFQTRLGDIHVLYGTSQHLDGFLHPLGGCT